MLPDTLGIIGLGAIGGSIAWQASAAGVRRVLGFSRHPAEGVAAVRAGAVTELAASAGHVVHRADLVILAVPPAAALRLLADVPAGLRPEAFCTDVASVKGPVVAVAQRIGLASRFAGSHPLVRSRRQGFAAAQPRRFCGALVYVTPVGRDDAAAREVADFWASVLQAEPVIVGADAHDAIVAWTSHLPYAVATAVTHALASRGPRGVTYGPGARDVARVADGDVATWRDLLLMNRSAILATLDEFEGSVGALRRALQDGDPVAVGRWLETGAAWRRRLPP
jgi:prephenate dehydrogenase